MNQCSDCLKTASGNCGKHLESYIGAVGFTAAVEAPQKTVRQLVDEAVAKAVLQEKSSWLEILQAWKQGNPKNHIACGCKKCFALGEALRKAPVYLENPL
jgi:hypothetical protein